MIEWNKIANNAISSIVTMAFVGACLIVWKGATTVDDKVNSATAALKQQADYMQKAVEVIQQELIEVKTKQNEIIQLINSIDSKEQVGGSKPQEIFFYEDPKQKIAPVPEIPPDYIQQRLPDIRQMGK